MTGGSGSQKARRLGIMLGDQATIRAAVAELSRAFSAEGGNAVRSAAALGIGHRTLMEWVERHPEVRDALEKARKAPKKTRNPATTGAKTRRRSTP